MLDPLLFLSTFLGQGSHRISSVEIADRYSHDVNACIA
jgi:hypothetical protein